MTSVPTALVLDGDSGQALEVVRSLGRDGWTVLAPAGTRSGASRHTSRQVTLADPSDPVAFASGFRRALAEERIDLVAPCSDASAEHVWQLRPDGAVLGGDRSAFTLAVDKARTLEAADAAGFPTPRWLAPTSVDEAVDFALGIGLPCVVKPRRSFSAANGRLVQRRHRLVAGREDLARALDDLTERSGSLPLVQDHVPGRSLAIAAVAARGRIVASVARETISFWPIAGGTSVWRRTIAPTAPGVAEACRLLLELDYTGLAEVEYQLRTAVRLARPRDRRRCRPPGHRRPHRPRRGTPRTARLPSRRGDALARR
jgi:predicted ATP-grasp superfamily ATP-dependent carboligase